MHHMEGPDRKPPGGSGRLAVRETTCKTILNRTRIDDYSLNCYTGCSHGCIYCYARFMQRFHPHPEPWGAFVDVKVNAVAALMRQLRRTGPGEVFVSSACDGWQPVEAERGLTRACCELLVKCGFGVNVLTKSALIARDLDLFSDRRGTGSRRSRIGVTVTTLDERLAALWEPGASSVGQRLRALEEARARGLRTAVMFGPLLPFLSDGAESIDGLFRTAGELGIDVIWVDALNPRPRVWPSVHGLLQSDFPELISPYRRVLFDRAKRMEYVHRLRSTVIRAAEKRGLSDRLAGCP
jgi:DNA repair photolyase